MTINDRIKSIRINQGLSQAKFGARIGANRDMVNNVENRRSNANDLYIKAICREFNVSEIWLKTGEGEVYKSLERETEIAQYIGDVFSQDDILKKRFLVALSRLSSSELEAIFKFAQELLKD